MENGAQALLMAAAALIFIVALALSLTTLSNAKSTADIVLSYSDREMYQEYVNPDLESYIDGGRTVKFHTVLSTIERMGHENFAVRILKSNGEEIFNLDYSVLNDEDGSNKDAWGIIHKKINKFIEDNYSKYCNSDFRETFVEVNVTGSAYTGDDGASLEENVGKKIYITYKALN